MARTLLGLSATSALFCALLVLGIGCGDDDGSGAAAPEAAPSVEELESVSEAAADETTREAMRAALDREFPLHGLVTKVSLQIRQGPDPDAEVIGWLRVGERVRAAGPGTESPGCHSGWYRVAPRGFACAGQGLDLGDAPPEVEELAPPARREQALPYDYYFVKEPVVPQYHVLPSRDQQRAGQGWAERYLELRQSNEDRAARFWRGDLGPSSQRHAAVGRYLKRGFFIAGTETQIRSRRRFVHTTSGGFVKEAQLEQRTGSEFHGIELGPSRQLPIPFVLRDARLRIRRTRDDGTERFVRDEESQPLIRQTVAENWLRRERIGDHFYHVLEHGEGEGGEPELRYLRDWFIGVAERLEPPFELLAEDEPWVHVDLSSQTLVIYRGTEPAYVTLVSTGLEGHETPTGVFTIRQKMVTDTMANLGPDAGDDAYSIADVPWTQYFDGSIALHTAFWHHRFGIPRSHGCVNLAPADAHRVFRETWPRVPDGWHGVATQHGGFRASRVVVTD